MPRTFNLSTIAAIYAKPFDEWTEEEAVYVRAYEVESDRRREERKRKETERKAESDEKKADGERKIREYREMMKRYEHNERSGTIEWFVHKAMEGIGEREVPRIVNHADRAFDYLAEAYRMEVERWGGILLLDDHTKRAIADVSRWAVQHKKPGLLLRGYLGVGKTTMLNALMKVFQVLENKRMMVVDARSIAKYAKDSKSEFDGLCKEKMLGIDDLGTEPLTVKSYGNDLTPVVELLTERYNKRMFTVITTNLAKKMVDGKEVDELQEIYGDRLYDRFKEMFNTISYDANQQSYRK